MITSGKERLKRLLSEEMKWLKVETNVRLRILDAIDDVLEDEIEADIFRKTTQDSPEWTGATNFQS